MVEAVNCFVNKYCLCVNSWVCDNISYSDKLNVYCSVLLMRFFPIAAFGREWIVGFSQSLIHHHGLFSSCGCLSSLNVGSEAQAGRLNTQ